MSINLFDAWQELVQKPIGKLDDDAFSRVRVIHMNGAQGYRYALLEEAA